MLLALSTYSTIFAWSAITGNPSGYNFLGSPWDTLSASVWNDMVRWLKLTADNTRNIFSDGTNVWIWAAPWTDKLQVTGTMKATSTIFSNNLLLQWDGTNGYVRPNNAWSNLYLWANNTNYMTILSAGNVWIWTTTPSWLLNLVQAWGYNSEATSAIRIYNTAASPSTGLQFWVDATNGIWYIQAMQPGVSWTNKNLALQANGWNVVIGGTALGTGLKFDVYGSVWASSYCDSNGNNCFTAAANTLSGAGTANYVAKYNAAASLTASQIQDNGSGVGIGKSPNAAFRFDVNGKIAAWNYSSSAASINTNSLEVWGVAPNSSNWDGTIYFIDQWDIAHQLRYTLWTLYFEGAGNGYGTSTTPTFQVWGTIYAWVNGWWIWIGTTSLTWGMKLDVLWDAKIRGTQINTDAIEVSTYNSWNRWAYIDFHGDDTYTDFDLRLLHDNTGPNWSSSLVTRWVWNLNILTTEAGPIRISTASTERLTILWNGNIWVWSATPNTKFAIGNNVATGPMDNYSEYQIMLYDAGTPINSYGIWIRASTLLFNTASLADFDVNWVNALSLSSTSLDLKAGSMLRMYNIGWTNFVALKAGTTIPSNVTWTLPTADGIANAVLATDGVWNLTFISEWGGWVSKVVKKFPQTTDGWEWYYNCVIMNDDTVKCWGQDTQWQVGDWSPAVNKSFPQTIYLPSAADKLYTNMGNVFALLKDGTLYSWWYNGSGEVGDGTTTHRYYPVRVWTLTWVTKVAISKEDVEVSGNSACALTSAWAVYCWGYNGVGQLWDNTVVSKSTPTLIVASWVTDIYDGLGYYGNFCLKKNDNSTWCWGYNGYGNVWDNTTTQRNIPTNISFSTVLNMCWAGSYSAAYGHRCAVKTDGTVWCWGNNSNWQLGDGTATQRNLPTQVPGITTAVSTTCWLLNSYALLSDGTVRSWWYNGYGQLGNGTTTQSPSPINPWLSWVTKIVQGWDYYGTWSESVCYLINNGQVKCTWYNAYWQMWDDTATTRTTPWAVIWITNAIDVMFRSYATGSEVCALLSTGVMKCWWYNAQWQLWNGTVSTMYTPQDVLF